MFSQDYISHVNNILTLDTPACNHSNTVWKYLRYHYKRILVCNSKFIYFLFLL